MEEIGREKGQGSEEEMANLKRVKEESVKDFGMLLMIYLYKNRGVVFNIVTHISICK